MPTRKSRLNKTEDQENHNSLSQLEEMGIPIGCAVDRLHEPDWITLEQTGYELAKIYELPLNEVVVVVPAQMTILKSGILITHLAIITPWEDWPLDLCDPEESSYYEKLIGGLYHLPAAVLNRALISELPLRRRQGEGVIMAHGYTSVPRECDDQSLVSVKLLLGDGRRKEFSFDFTVEVDRRVMRKCEKQRQRECRAFSQSAKGGGLYEPRRGQPEDQKSVAPEKPSSIRKVAASLPEPVTQEAGPSQDRNSMTRQIPTRGDNGFVADTAGNVESGGCCLRPWYNDHG